MRQTDPWQWSVLLRGGTRVGEADVGTIRALPAHSIAELHLRTLSGGHVWVDYDTGHGHIGEAIVTCPFPGEGLLVPLFFRRWKSVGGALPKAEFRALGYAYYGQDQGPLFAALLVRDAATELRWTTAWGPETIHHTASQALLIGGCE